MVGFRLWLESKKPGLEEAERILLASGLEKKEAKKLLRGIDRTDPYDDKRWSAAIARWLVDKKIKTPDDPADDLRELKEVYPVLKESPAPAPNKKRSAEHRRLMSSVPKPEDSTPGDLGPWVRDAEKYVDPASYDDAGLEKHPGWDRKRVGKYEYSVYVVRERDDCAAPAIENVFSYCVVTDMFGYYGGPPYYAVARRRVRAGGVPLPLKQYAIVIPHFVDGDRDEAVRDPTNTRMLSPEETQPIRDLLDELLGHHFVRGMRGEQPSQEDIRSAASSVDNARKLLIDYPLMSDELRQELERRLAENPGRAFKYAREVLEKGWREHGHPDWQGIERRIAEDPGLAFNYVSEMLGKGWRAHGHPDWVEIERGIGGDPWRAFDYARDVLKKSWKEHGHPDWVEIERGIAEDPGRANWYAQYSLRKGWRAHGHPDWVAIESTIGKDPVRAFDYARDVLKKGWKEHGHPDWREIERRIGDDPGRAYRYAKYVLRKSWKEHGRPDVEKVIEENPEVAALYASEFPKKS